MENVKFDKIMVSLKKLSVITVMITGLASVIIFCYTSIQELDFAILENRSQVLYGSDGSVMAYTLSSDTESYRFYTKVTDVSPLYLKMLIANEDRNFFSHCGVDLPSLFRAAFSNIRNGKITSGGSTIAMQLAKRLTNHERTYLNKLKETVQAIYLTQKYGRRQVLEWYLTLAPFGSNIEGVKAASLKWFNHLPVHLSPSEAALLTALPRAPEIIRPDRNPQSTIFYKNEVLRLSYEKEVLSYDVWQSSIHDILPHEMFPISQSAKSCLGSLSRDQVQITEPSFLLRGQARLGLAKNITMQLSGATTQISTNPDEQTPPVQENPENPSRILPADTPQKELYTFLDPVIQQILQHEGEVFHYHHNDGAVLSAVVLDATSHRLVGILGSSQLAISQMCLPFAQRSPGSALKPFAYGLAFEERKLHPYTILHDFSKNYGTWNPNNFTNKFSGNVTAANALTRSLNLPALEVMELIGPSHFLNFMNRFGKIIRVKNDVADYSVVLGSGTNSLYDLARLYAMINEDGLMYSYHIKESASQLQTDNDDEVLYNYIYQPQKNPVDGNSNDQEKLPDHLVFAPDEKIKSGTYLDTSKGGFPFFHADAARSIFEILKRTARPANVQLLNELSYKTGTSSHFTDALAVGSVGNYTVAVAVRIPDNKLGAYRYSGYKDAVPHLFNIVQQLHPRFWRKPQIDSELLKMHQTEYFKENLKEEDYLNPQALKIIFPLSGTTVMPDFEGRIFLSHTGGKGKIYMVINGQQELLAPFVPTEAGLYKITLMDEYGNSDTIKINVILNEENNTQE